MSTDRVLGILGVVIGLPGFFLRFLTGQQAIGILCVVIAALIFLLAVAAHYLTNLPPFVILAQQTTFAILDDEGTSAHLEKKYTLRPNYGHLETLTFKNISASEPINDVRWNGKVLPAAQVEKIQGMLEWIITIKFITPPARRK